MDEPGPFIRFLMYVLELPIPIKALILFGPYAILAWALVKAIQIGHRQADEAFRRALEGVEPADGTPIGPGQVEVRFRTYHGFFVHVTTTEHRFRGQPDAAREALWRLHMFNCSRGVFSQWHVLIPLVSLARYDRQKRSIDRQEAVFLGIAPRDWL